MEGRDHGEMLTRFEEMFGTVVEHEVIKLILQSCDWDASTASDTLLGMIDKDNLPPHVRSALTADAIVRGANRRQPATPCHDHHTVNTTSTTQPSAINSAFDHHASNQTHVGPRVTSNSFSSDRETIPPPSSPSQSPHHPVRSSNNTPDPLNWALAAQFVPKASDGDKNGGLSSPKRLSNASKHVPNVISSDGQPSRKEVIIGKILTSRRLMVLLRGLPGSGKTTVAKELKGRGGVVLSADDFFCDKHGRYVYNASKIGEAHQWNKHRAIQRLKEGRSPVIIDNTNLQAWEMKPYIQLGLQYGYDLEILDMDTRWNLNCKELARRNIHGVPAKKIEEMKERYERNVRVEDLIASLQGSDASQQSPSRNAAPRSIENDFQGMNLTPKCSPFNARIPVVDSDTEVKRSNMEEGEECDEYMKEDLGFDSDEDVIVEGYYDQIIPTIDGTNNEEQQLSEFVKRLSLSASDIKETLSCDQENDASSAASDPETPERISTVDEDLNGPIDLTLAVQTSSPKRGGRKGETVERTDNLQAEPNLTLTSTESAVDEEIRIQTLLDEACRSIDLSKSEKEWDSLTSKIAEENFSEDKFNDLVTSFGCALKKQMESRDADTNSDGDVRNTTSNVMSEDFAMYDFCSNMEDKTGQPLSSLITKLSRSSDSNNIPSINIVEPNKEDSICIVSLNNDSLTNDLPRNSMLLNAEEQVSRLNSSTEEDEKQTTDMLKHVTVKSSPNKSKENEDKKQEESESRNSTSNERPTSPAELNKTQPSFDAAHTQPSLDTAHTQPFLDTAHTQPFLDTSHTQPFLDTAHTQPFLDTAHTQPFLDTAHTQPFLDTAHTQPSLDTAHTQPFLDTAHTQPFLDTAHTQSSINAAHMQPDSNGLISWECVDITSGLSSVNWDSKPDSMENDTATPKSCRTQRSRPAGDPSRWLGESDAQSESISDAVSSWVAVEGNTPDWDEQEPTRTNTSTHSSPLRSAMASTSSKDKEESQSHTGAISKVRKHRRHNSPSPSSNSDTQDDAVGTDHSKTVTAQDRTKTIFTNVETQTLFIDFESLQLDEDLYELKVLYGRAHHDPVTTPECNFSKKGPLTKGELRLDKGTMTENVYDNLTASSFQNLVAFFPNIPKDDLRDVFEKCKHDSDWAMNVLLDSGYEMSDPANLTTNDDNDDINTEADPVTETSTEDRSIDSQDTDDTPSDSVSEDKTRRVRQSRQPQDLATKMEIEQSFEFPESVGDQVLRLTGKKYDDLNMTKIKKMKARNQAGKQNDSPSKAKGKESAKEEEIEGAQYITLVMDPLFASQLNMLFGPVGECEISGDLTHEDRSVVLPLEICEMIHSYWARTVNGKFMHEAEILDTLLRQDEMLARKLQEEENAAFNSDNGDDGEADDGLLQDQPVCFQEIMNLEQALQESLANQTTEDTSISSQLNLQRLYKEYPHVDPTALREEYVRNNHKYNPTVEQLNQRYGKEATAPKTVIAPEALSRYEQEMIERVQQTSLEEHNMTMSTAPDTNIVPDNPQMYRDEAQSHYHQRQEAFRKAQEAYRRGMKTAAAYYAHIGNLHSERLREANQRASHKILEAKNAHRKDANCLDLHLLHVPEAISATQAFLYERQRVLIARGIRQMEVSLITGRGSHSAGGQAVLKPSIKEHLQKHGYSFYEANSGMLKVVLHSKPS